MSRPSIPSPHICITLDGNAYCAVWNDFDDLKASPAGFGKTPDEAIAALAKSSGRSLESESFDTQAALVKYRRVIAQLEVQTTDEGRAEFEVIAQRLRDDWKARDGKDSLYETAFGEPLDD